MPFTPADLKRLKKRIPDEGTYVGASILVDGAELSALIARLEAAEDYMQHNLCDCEGCDQAGGGVEIHHRGQSAYR